MAALRTRPPELVFDPPDGAEWRPCAKPTGNEFAYRDVGILISANGRSRSSGLARVIAAMAKSVTNTHAILFSPCPVPHVTKGEATFADSLSTGSREDFTCSFPVS